MATLRHDQDVGKQLICPITLELPVDPVMAEDGYVRYDYHFPKVLSFFNVWLSLNPHMPLLLLSQFLYIHDLVTTTTTTTPVEFMSALQFKSTLILKKRTTIIMSSPQ